MKLILHPPTLICILCRLENCTQKWTTPYLKIHVCCIIYKPTHVPVSKRNTRRIIVCSATGIRHFLLPRKSFQMNSICFIVFQRKDTGLKSGEPLMMKSSQPLLTGRLTFSYSQTVFKSQFAIYLFGPPVHMHSGLICITFCLVMIGPKVTHQKNHISYA